MVNIVICGAMGRMGQTVYSLAKKDKEIKVVGLVEAQNSQWIGKQVDDMEITHDLNLVIKNADVVVEFTNPEATISHLKITKDAGKKMVIGTTGLSEEQLKLVEEASKHIPIVLSPNMSIGVNLLFSLVKTVAKTIPFYEVEIIEVHHNQKKDAPSGTALKLADIISKELNLNLDKAAIYGRKGITGPRKKDEIGIHAIRAGDVVGEHTVIFAGPGERIELTHKAHSRETFAFGALCAAKWVISQPAGLYSTSHVFNLQ